jgi:hypothetical protein
MHDAASRPRLINNKRPVLLSHHLGFNTGEKQVFIRKGLKLYNKTDHGASPLSAKNLG